MKQVDPANIAGCAEVFSDDFVWHYFNPQLPEMHGDYVGFEGLRTFFAKMADGTNGTFTVNPVSMTAMGDELVVVQARNTMTYPDRRIELDAVVVWRIVDGRITEAWDIPAIYTAKVQSV